MLKGNANPVHSLCVTALCFACQIVNSRLYMSVNLVRKVIVY